MSTDGADHQFIVRWYTDSDVAFSPFNKKKQFNLSKSTIYFEILKIFDTKM